MKTIKLITAILAMLFAILSLTNILNDDIAMPIMMFFLGISEVVISYEMFKSGRKSTGYIMAAIALFIFITIFVVLFF